MTMHASHRTLKQSLTFLILCTLVLFVSRPLAVADGDPLLEEEVRSKLADAFEAVSDVERAGGEISFVVDELNRALTLLDDGNLEEAASVIDAVLASVPDLQYAGLIATRNQQVATGSALTVLAVFGVLVWRFGRRLFWHLWLRSKRKWRVHL